MVYIMPTEPLYLSELLDHALSCPFVASILWKVAVGSRLSSKEPAWEDTSTWRIS
jgi:hypothetical protein